MTIKRLAQVRRVLAWALFAVVADVGAARAATFSVTNSGDAGDANPGDGVCATAGAVCTLRAAVEEANALAGTDAINVSALTITLGSQLRLSQSVTIAGAGQALTIVDANNNSRAFFIVQQTGTYTISGMTIRNGFVNADTDPEPLPPHPNGGDGRGHGGAIYNASSLTLSNVSIINSSALMGGGVFNMFGPLSTLTINNVSITGCSSTSTVFPKGGGGIFNGGG